MEIDFRYYASLLRRRLLLVVLPALAVLVAAVGATVLIPPLYRSAATILVETQQIPQDLVRPTVTTGANERIQVIEQRLMTRENLLRVVQKYKLYPGKQMSPTELVDQMRKAAQIEQVFLALSGRRNESQAIAFTVAFEYADATVASQVASEFVTLILDEDLRSRTDQASEATRFLMAESDRLGQELVKIKSQISQFKAENRDALPETLEYRRSMLYRQQSDLAALDREIAGMGDERKLWEMRDANELPSADATSLSTLIAQARLELARKRASFTETHPDVKRLVQQIKELELQASQPQNAVASDQGTHVASPQIATIQARIDAATKQREAMSAALDKIQKSIADTVQVEMGLATLTRRQEETQRSYQDATTKLAQARTGERLEENRQGERFEVIEQPTVPTSPVWPNRPMLLALGLFASIGAGVAPLVLTEVMDPSIRRSIDLEKKFGRAALVTVPFIETLREVRRRKRFWTLGAVAAAAGLCLSLLLVHVLVKPLDSIWYNITDRLG